jgi:ribonuclease J
MYDDSGAVVSEVVLKDRIHMANEGMFVVLLTLQRGTGRLLTSPDIISRGFIYLRDSEELMGLIRQYLKQKIARGFGGKRVDLDQMKKEIKDEITHILYDQTRRTPIVIPVINEIGGGGGGRDQQAGGRRPANADTSNQQERNRSQGQRQGRPQPQAQPVPAPAAAVEAQAAPFERPAAKQFPPKQVPDTEAVQPKTHFDTRGY